MTQQLDPQLLVKTARIFGALDHRMRDGRSAAVKQTKTIRQLRDEGYTYESIGEAAGLTRERVRQLATRFDR